MNNPAADTRTGLAEAAIQALETEADSVLALRDRIDADFERACALLLACSGRIVITGMGKSGHIAGKLAATLASTGSPAFFVHPAEASHGDLGMITDQDVVIALSNSGETGELVTILPVIKRSGVVLISLTGRADSTLARMADVNLDVSVAKEACPLNLAPTSSTTAALAMGDALAIALLHARGFTREDFARSHPGGSLGRQLLLRNRDIMHSGARIPVVRDDAPLAEALLEITNKGLGMTAVKNANGQLVGVFTDGDLRRVLDDQLNVQETVIGAVMTRDGKTVHPDALAAEAVKLMETHAINALLVVDDDGALVGALNMHDLLRSGVV